MDHQQDQPDNPEGRFRGHRIRGDGQVRCLGLRDAAAGLPDGLRENLPCHRQCSAIQEAGNMEHRRLHRRVRRAWYRDGCRNAFPVMDRLDEIRFGDQQQCPLHLQLSYAALLRRILRRVRARAPLVLGDPAEQDLPVGPRCGCHRRHRPDVRGPPGTHAVALVADAGGICLCHGLVPGSERRREGRDDQMARSERRGRKAGQCAGTAAKG